MLWKDVDFKTACAELSTGIGASHAEHSHPRPAPALPTTPPPPNEQWRHRAEQFVAWAEASLAGKAGAGAREYLEKERGLSPETQRVFRLGYNPTNLYDAPARWGLEGRKIWLPRGIVIPGYSQGQPWYVKIRRPLPADILGHHIGAWRKRDSLPDVKFGGLRGGRTTLFRLELLDHLPVLMLAEGEFDVVLLWEYCAEFCDVGTLGGARAKFDALDLALLTRYLVVLVVHDDDKAGEEGRRYVAKIQKRTRRVVSIPPPAHDLTDFWKSGGDVRVWAARHVARALGDALKGLQIEGPLMDRWFTILEISRREAKR
jgi:hypothetical protein